MAAFATTYSSCQLRARIPPYPILHAQLAAWPTSSVRAEITPQRPLTCDHLDGRLPSENGLRTGFLCACSKHTSVRDLFQLEDACRHLVRVLRFFLPRDRWVTRTNLKAKSNLHTRRCEHFTQYYNLDMPRTIRVAYRQRCRAAQCATIANHRYRVIG